MGAVHVPRGVPVLRAISPFIMCRPSVVSCGVVSCGVGADGYVGLVCG